MIPLRDNVPTRHFPVVTLGLIAANVLVFVLYQDAGGNPGFTSSVNELAYHPCEVEDSCRQVGEDWPATIFSSLFLHAGWGHLLGNMLFLWIFGNNVEDSLGRVRFIIFYVLGGLAATAAQTFVTLGWGSAQDAAIPNLGASGAISAVLGAYFLLHPYGRITTFVVPFFLFQVPAMVFLGIYFLYQLLIGGYAFVHPEAGGGVAYFAHIGGIAFGLLTVRLFAAGRPRPRMGF
ncbi:MAG TPA: rhomboid family intramembrane serine protease [Gaiellaceae bacterium]|jgi:membrane associated rhomboid family serine protease|nr:rhomboid family intramembrane serine protease [Gaiellaceae bacterium]